MRFLGLGVPEWLTILALVGGLILTFRVMAKASVRYEAARKAREARQGIEPEAGRLGETREETKPKGKRDEDRHPS